MDILLILTYTAICVAIFKVFKIPLNKWSVPTAILGGILIIGALLLIMNYNHPYAKYAKEIFVSVPIIPVVNGPVVSVDVTANMLVKRGDVLFRIDPTPFKVEVLRKRALLSDAGQGVLEQAEVWMAAGAKVDAARADRDQAKQVYDRYQAASEVYSAVQVESRKQIYLASEAQLEASKAQENQARLQSDSQFEGEDTQVAQLRAELRLAEYNLQHAVVRAPTDGVVTQLALREGMMVMPNPLRPALVFIPEQRREIVGSFWQNSMRLIKPGQEAEVTLDAVPGHVFKGHVQTLLPAMNEGEVQSGGVLVSASRLAQNGRAMAVIELEEDLAEYGLPRGVQGHVAVYTDSFAHVSVIRKVLLRMAGWVNYLYPLK